MGLIAHLKRFEFFVSHVILKTKKVSWNSEPVNVPGVAWSDYETETAFQIFCLTYLRKTDLNGSKWWHHSANERQGARVGFTAKMMGQSKGMPDLIHFGYKLAIELKMPGKAASARQLEWLEYLAGLGWFCEVVTSFERFRAIVEERRRIVEPGAG